MYVNQMWTAVRKAVTHDLPAIILEKRTDDAELEQEGNPYIRDIMKLFKFYRTSFTTDEDKGDIIMSISYLSYTGGYEAARYVGQKILPEFTQILTKDSLYLQICILKAMSQIVCRVKENQMQIAENEEVLRFVTNMIGDSHNIRRSRWAAYFLNTLATDNVAVFRRLIKIPNLEENLRLEAERDEPWVMWEKNYALVLLKLLGLPTGSEDKEKDQK